MDYKDYYQVLGVPRNADDKAIKKAYRQLVRENHPDVNRDDPNAEKRIKEINEAYAVLSDSEKRSKYDRLGKDWERFERSGGQPQDFDWGSWGSPGGGGSRGRTMSPQEFEQLFGNFGGRGSSPGGSGFSSFFDQLFGGAAGGMPGGINDPRSGLGSRGQAPRTSEVSVTVTLEEALHGASRTLQRSDGTRLEVNIPRGVRSGSKIRMSGAGEGGDLYLKVEVTPHPQFQRQGDDLTVIVPVDIYTAVLGGEVQLPTLERSVVLTVPANSQSGRKMRLRGLGMPNLRNPSQRGDLYAVLEVTLPTQLSAQERVLFEQLRDLQG